MNTGYGSTGGTWGSNSIWGNGGLNGGFGTRATTRDNSASRDAARQTSTSDTEVVEGKSGSGSLLDNSVSEEWSHRSPWAAQRSQPTGRSVSLAKPNDVPSFQQRGASNVGLPSLSPPSAESFSLLGPRTQTINITSATSANPRTGFTSPYTNGTSNRGVEQPPNVYTKFDRPTDPNARKFPDSAKDGVWPDYSPTDERKPSFPMQFGSRAFSHPVSRDENTPASRHGGGEAPQFVSPDYCRSSQRPTQANSRAPSLSSQSNGVYNSPHEPNPDYLAAQLSQLAMHNDGRPPSSYRSGTAAHSPWLNTQLGQSTGLSSSRSNWNGYDDANIAGAAEEQDRRSMSYGRADDQFSPHSSRPSADFSSMRNTTHRFAQTPTAPEFTPGRPYVAMRTSSGSYDNTSLSSFSFGNEDARRQPTFKSQIQDSPVYIDPRTQQLLATPQLRTSFGQFFNPYGMPSAIQLGPVTYGQLASMQMPDQLMSPEDLSAREGVQSTLMYEFKSNPKARRYELKDIYEHIVEFAGDQHGSRFVQTKLETANSDEKDRVFREIEPNAVQLMTDIFGNYVIQKFFEHGDQTHKKILAHKMKGRVLNLSVSMYGCRVVQKALDHVLVNQQAELIEELRHHVVECVRDQNGNHVIQKAIERCSPHSIQFIIAAFQGEVQQLAIHPYGCRVIQRCLERCDPHSKEMVMEELMSGIHSMISDQFGNYVVQHVVEHDEGLGRKHVLDIVGRNLETFSKHKFASNVVEKCLERADDEWRRRVVNMIVYSNPRRGEGEGVFVGMIKDNFGNYVIRKCSSETTKIRFGGSSSPRLPSLTLSCRKTPRHFVARRLHGLPRSAAPSHFAGEAHRVRQAGHLDREEDAPLPALWPIITRSWRRFLEPTRPSVPIANAAFREQLPFCGEYATATYGGHAESAELAGAEH